MESSEVIEMCYGHPYCKYEIRHGEFAGDCKKPKHAVCPESLEDNDTDEYWDSLETHPWDEATVEDWA